VSARTLLPLLLATSALAQASGRIEGTVLGPDGLPLVGARVSARSPTQIGGVLRQETDAAGEFRFLGLLPGTFSVLVERSGYRSDERTGLYVGVNRTVSLTFLLEALRPAPAQVKTETYVIKAQRPVVDAHRTSTGESLPSDFVQKVPVFVRRPQSVTDFAPGVVSQQISTGTAGNPNIRGGADFNNSYTVDGVDTTDPVTHTFGTNFNFDAVSDVEVQTAGMGAEYGAVTGGATNIVTKSGSNDLHADASAYAQHPDLALKDPKVGEFREENVNLNLSGPILRDRLWYFGSVQLDDRVTSIPCDADALPFGLCPHPELHRLGVLYLGKLTFQATPTHKLTFWTQGERTGIDNTAQDQTTAPEAEGHQDQSTQILSVAHEWVPNRTVFLKSQGSFQRQRLQVFPQSGDSDTPGYDADSVTGISSHNYTRVVDDIRYRAALNQTLTLFLDHLLLPMEPRAGYKFNYTWNPRSVRVPGDTTYQTQGDVLESAASPGRRTTYCALGPDPEHPDRCIQGANETTTKGIFVSGFVEDTLKFTRFVQVTPGVGIHYGQTKNYADDTITNFVTGTPHLNGTWDPTKDGKTVIRAGYNQYVDVGFLSIPGFVNRNLFSKRCEYDPASSTPGNPQFTNNCVTQGGTEGVTVGHPQGKNGPEEKLRPPRTHEFLFGAERELLPGFSAGTEVVYRQYNHLFEDRETNVVWNERGDDLVTTRDPSSPTTVVFDLETPDEAHRRYVSASLTGRRYVGKWNFLGSYTWARSEGTVNEGFATLFLDNYTQNKFYDGFLPDDRRHTLKFYTSYQLTTSWNLGVAFSYATGTPYSKRFFNKVYSDFTDLRSARGTDPRDVNNPDDDVEARVPDLTQIDLKGVYNLKRLTGVNLDAIAEIFNLLNTSTALRVEERNINADDPTAAVHYGDTIRPQDPFRVRLGLRYRY
jgi:carboxypeptidase family protein/TonB-dependent receptor-like protein